MRGRSATALIALSDVLPSHSRPKSPRGGPPWPLRLSKVVWPPLNYAPNAPLSARTRDSTRAPASRSNVPSKQGSRYTCLGPLAPTTRPLTHPLRPLNLAHSRPSALPHCPASSSQTRLPDAQLSPADRARPGGMTDTRHRMCGDIERGLGRLGKPVRTDVFGFPPPPIRSTSPPRRVVRAAAEPSLASINVSYMH